jgi:hypothetical protein
MFGFCGGESADKKKSQRSWDPLGGGGGGKVNKNLDRCTDRPEDAVGETAEERAMFVGTGKADVDNWEMDSDEDDPPAKSKSKGMWDTLKILAGGSRFLYICIYTYIYTCIHTICIYAYIYIYIYTYIHIYIYTYIGR